MSALANFTAATSQPVDFRHDAEKILLVDDDPGIRVMLSRVLKDAGYGVECASDGNEALELAKDRNVNLVLLDLNMPGKDGWDTYEQLTSDHPLLPVIIITARPSQQFTALAAGTGVLMEKPLDLPKLILAIRDMLDEPEGIRIARLAGRPAEFHYIPPTQSEFAEVVEWDKS
jgi:DNA-binding response OmpR family regulator